jgi:pyridoxal phosphate-dependent aminotransferase EpsN
MVKKRIYLSPPHMGPDERQLLVEAFESNWVAPLGPHVDAFERELAAHVGIPHAVALSSGTGALHLALVVLGVGRDADVLTSTFTFAATANAITYVGARPVFIDSDRSTWNMDPALLSEEIERRAKANRLPKAVVVVDLYGQCADYDPISAICQRYGIPLIEDAAEALGATYKGKPAGTFGSIGIFSFNGNKIITTGGGGMLVSERKEYADKVRFLATQARDPAPHYEHSHIGYNYRLSNLLAAVGRGQLRVLDDRVRARRANRDFYARALRDQPGIELIPEAPYGGGTAWLTCVLVDAERFGATPSKIREVLAENDIEARPVWKPMHMQPVFAACPVIGGEVTRDLFERGLCLPSGSALTNEELERVASIVIDVGRAGRG